MVLESLINPLTAEKHPWEMFFIGLLYHTISLFLAAWVFTSYASIVSVFLTTMACIPLVYLAIKQEETKDKIIDKEWILLKEHGHVLSFLMFLFMGIMASVAFWYVMLPILLEVLSVWFPSLFAQTPIDAFYTNLFEAQTDSINAISARITGQVINQATMFSIILENNIKVLLLCLLFSFFYGVGSIFVLAWNASIVGVAMGNFIITKLNANLSHITVLPLAVARYFTHGIFEILAYFTIGLAGGIISVAVIQHEVGTKQFKHILIDSIDLIILSFILIIIGAVIEVYVTPVFA